LLKENILIKTVMAISAYVMGKANELRTTSIDEIWMLA